MRQVILQVEREVQQLHVLWCRSWPPDAAVDWPLDAPHMSPASDLTPVFVVAESGCTWLQGGGVCSLQARAMVPELLAEARDGILRLQTCLRKKCSHRQQVQKAVEADGGA